jgi:hypothetical protein
VIKQITKNIENADEIKGGLKAIVASVDIGRSWKRGEATRADVSYAQMGLAFEYYMENSKNLYDPFTADLHQSLWLRYVGDSFLATNDDEITEETTGMSTNSIDVIRRQCFEQQKLHYSPETIIWIAKGKRNLASIADKKWVNSSALAHSAFHH